MVPQPTPEPVDLTTIEGRLDSLEIESGSIRDDFNQFTSSFLLISSSINSQLEDLRSSLISCCPPTSTPNPTSTPQPTPPPTATQNPTPEPTASPLPTATPVPTATPQPTLNPTATAQPTPEPTSSPNPTPTSTIPQPTATPQPTSSTLYFVRKVVDTMNPWANEDGYDSLGQTVGLSETLQWVCDTVNGPFPGISSVVNNQGTVDSPHIWTSAPGNGYNVPQVGDVIYRDQSGSQYFEIGGFLVYTTPINNVGSYTWISVGANGTVVSVDQLDCDMVVPPTATPIDTATPVPTSTPNPTPTTTQTVTLNLNNSISLGQSTTGFTSMGDITTVNNAICDFIGDNSYQLNGQVYTLDTPTIGIGTTLRTLSGNGIPVNNILVENIQDGQYLAGDDYYFIQTDENGVVITYQQMGNCPTPQPTSTPIPTATPQTEFSTTINVRVLQSFTNTLSGLQFWMADLPQSVSVVQPYDPNLNWYQVGTFDDIDNCSQGGGLSNGITFTVTGGHTDFHYKAIHFRNSDGTVIHGLRYETTSGICNWNWTNMYTINVGVQTLNYDRTIDNYVKIYSNTSNVNVAPTATPQATPVPTATEVPTATPNPTATAEPTPEPTATEAPTATPNPTATEQPTPQPTATPQPTPDATPPPTATIQPTPNPTATELPTSTPNPTATPQPTPNPTATELPTSTPNPTATPQPTPEPTATVPPTATPNPTATQQPTSTPTPTVFYEPITLISSLNGSGFVVNGSTKGEAETFICNNPINNWQSNSVIRTSGDPNSPQTGDVLYEYETYPGAGYTPWINQTRLFLISGGDQNDLSSWRWLETGPDGELTVRELDPCPTSTPTITPNPTATPQPTPTATVDTANTIFVHIPN